MLCSVNQSDAASKRRAAAVLRRLRRSDDPLAFAATGNVVNLMDALHKSLNVAGKGGASQPAKGRRPKKAASASANADGDFRQGRSQGQGSRQGNKAAGTPAQGRVGRSSVIENFKKGECRHACPVPSASQWCHTSGWSGVSFLRFDHNVRLYPIIQKPVAGLARP
jgi:hypothetical protein